MKKNPQNSVGKGRQPAGPLYLGWWHQPDIGRHNYYNLRLSMDTNGHIEATFFDVIDVGTLRGGFDSNGFVWLTRRAGGFDTYYVGRRERTTLAGAWVVDSGDWIRRNMPHRSYGLWRMWPYEEQDPKGANQEASRAAKLPSPLRLVLNNLVAMSRFYPLMRQAIRESENSSVREALEQQYAEVQRLRELAMASRPVDDPWVDPERKLRISTRRYFEDLGPMRKQLLNRLGPSVHEGRAGTRRY